MSHLMENNMRRGRRFGFNYKVIRRGEAVVEVHLNDGTIGRADCNFDSGDTFSFKTGKNIALRRALSQWYGNEIAQKQRELDVLWADRIEMEGRCAVGND